MNSSGGNKTVLNVAGQTIGSGATVNVASGATFFITSPTSFSGVTFNLSGTGNGEGLGALRVEGATIAASSMVNLLSNSSIGGNNGNSTVNAVIGGTGFGFSKVGSATLTLGGANTYSGTTSISTGTLKAGSTGAFSASSAITLANTAGATLDTTGFNTTVGSLAGGGTNGGNVTLGAATLSVGGDNTSPAAYAGVISSTGAGGLTKIGTGTQTLSGANTYTGSTSVTGGKLLVSGSLTATSSVAVSSNAILSVNGLVATGATITNSGGTVQGQGTVGAVAVTSGGSLSPGLTTVNNSAGTLTSAGSGVSLDATSNFNIRLGVATPSDNDQLAMTAGDVTLGGANLQLTLGGFYQSQAMGFTYVIINGTAAGSFIAGQFAQGTTITDSNGDKFNILYNVDSTGAVAGNDVVLQLTAIPEPGTWAMMLAGAAMLMVVQRARRRIS